MSYEFLSAAYAALEAENDALRTKNSYLEERIKELRHVNRQDAMERAQHAHN